MLKKTFYIKWVWAVFIVALPCSTFGQISNDPNTPTNSNVTDSVELARTGEEYTAVRFEPVRKDEQPGLAVIFTGTHDLHYYARSETAPAPEYNLRISAKSTDLEFGEAIFPKWEIFTDPVGSKVEVYAGDFTVFIPITATKTPTEATAVDIDISISAMTCTSIECLLPFEKTLTTPIDYSQRDAWRPIGFDASSDTDITADDVEAPAYSTWFALFLAFIAGLGLNLMPCVWPVLPLVIMRIVNQAKEGKKQSLIMGLVFCGGILLFFACLAGANIILQSFYDRALNWGDHLRNPTIVTALALLMIVMALFMFGIFTITIPVSLSGTSESRKGYAGSVGMGFLAAILSTPCSFGILTVAFVWAQGQALFLGTLAIMMIGLGMAAPYAVLTSLPGGLKRLPRGGRWMELFKQSLGFVLLIIAVKLVKAVPEGNKINLLYFAVILSFCIWVWAVWVPYGTKFSRKWLVRSLAVLLAVLSFWFFFKPELVNWQDYDSTQIEAAKSGQQPVLIKFTADWCTNCEIVDKFVFQRKDIAKLIEQKNVLAIKADTTETGQPATIDLQNVYNEPGVPVTLLFLPGENEPIRLRELFFDEKLKDLLQALPDKTEQKS